MNARPVVVRTLKPVAVDALESRHRDTLHTLEKLNLLVGRLQDAFPDDKMRCCARDLMDFFSAPSREHHYREEQHFLQGLLKSDEPKLRKAAERLREDHAWIELHWLDIESQLRPLADGALSVDQRALQIATAMFAALTSDHMLCVQSLLERRCGEQAGRRASWPASCFHGSPTRPSCC